MNFSKITEAVKKNFEEGCKISSESAEDIIIQMLNYFKINPARFETSDEMLKEERGAVIGMKQIIENMHDSIRRGQLEIENLDSDKAVQFKINLDNPFKDAEGNPATETMVINSPNVKSTAALSKLADDVSFTKRAQTMIGSLSDGGLLGVQKLEGSDKNLVDNLSFFLLTV